MKDKTWIIIIGVAIVLFLIWFFSWLASYKEDPLPTATVTPIVLDTPVIPTATGIIIPALALPKAGYPPRHY